MLKFKVESLPDDVIKVDLLSLRNLGKLHLDLHCYSRYHFIPGSKTLF